MSDAYKQQILLWMRDYPEGIPTPELRSKFPRAPLREMEQTDKTIFYEGNRWFLEVDHVRDG